MKVTSIKKIQGTDRDVEFKQGRSLRLVLEKDNMGFSVHKTLIRKGEVGHWHYKNHKESCYCVEGKGMLINVKTKEGFMILPGTLYSLDNNDEHTFEAFEDVVLISIFNPPCKGGEIHKEDGSYEI